MTLRENLEFPFIRSRRNANRQTMEATIKEVLDDVELLEAIDQLPATLTCGDSTYVNAST